MHSAEHKVTPLHPPVDEAGRKPNPFRRTRTEPGQGPKRKIVSVDPQLVQRLEAERSRIEANLPRKRWRSSEEYVALALDLGIEALRAVEPIVDTLAPRWSAIAGDNPPAGE